MINTISSLSTRYVWPEQSVTGTKAYHQMDQAAFLEHMKQVESAGSANELNAIAVLSKSYSTGKTGAATFEDAFPQYNITTHVGNVNVSEVSWQRNDFPFWKYFDKNASADCLNDWKPAGAEPPMSSAQVQRGLNSIGSGQMAILIPEKLQEKMDADPAYSAEVMQRVQKWKEDYDNWDNATALSLGMNPAEHQASKSYCLNLDEDGNVKQYTVTSGGRMTKSDDTYAKARTSERNKRKEYQDRITQDTLQRRLYQQQLLQSGHLQAQLLAQDSIFADQTGIYAGLFNDDMFF